MTKLAQTAKGKRTCEGCGRTKELGQFPIHPRWGTPYRICDNCLYDRRILGARRRIAKQKAARQEEQVKQAKAAVTEVKQTAHITVLFARLEGVAIAMQNDGVLGLIAELKEATGND